MKLVRLGAERHAKVQSLLPWYVTGRLAENERAEVENHLAGCARCRAELALERQLHAAHALPSPPGSAERGWAALRRRIDDETVPSAKPAAAGWRWLLGAQFAAIAALVALLLAPRFEAPAYHGLGTAGAAANAVVMFRPDATEAQIRQALHQSGGHLVGGPTATHAYLLLLPAADADALARLRRQPAVTLAESLQVEGGR